MKYDEETLGYLIELHEKRADHYRALLKDFRKKHRVRRFARFAGQLLGVSLILLLAVVVVWMAVTMIRLVS